jgi:hypothetical protein
MAYSLSIPTYVCLHMRGLRNSGTAKGWLLPPEHFLVVSEPESTRLLFFLVEDTYLFL